MKQHYDEIEKLMQELSNPQPSTATPQTAPEQPEQMDQKFSPDFYALVERTQAHNARLESGEEEAAAGSRYLLDPTDAEAVRKENYSVVEDVALGAGHGFTRAIEESVQFGYDALNFFDDILGIDRISGEWSAKESMALSQPWEPQGTAGQVTSSITQFVTGFVGVGKFAKVAGLAGKAAKAGRLAQIGRSALQGAATDLIFIDPFEERLSNLVESVPALKNPVTAYLAADKDDGAIEARLKNVLEGMALGVLTDVTFESIRGLRHWRQAKKAGKTPEQLEKLAEEVFKGADEAAAKAGLTEEIAQEAATAKPAAGAANVAEAVQQGAQAADAVAKGAITVDAAIEQGSDAINKLLDAAEQAGFSRDEVFSRAGEIFEAAKRGDIGGEEVLQGVSDIFERIGQQVNPQGAEQVAAIRNGAGLNEWLERIAERQAKNIPPDPFEVTHSILNADKMQPDQQNMFSALTETLRDYRQEVQFRPQSMKELREESARIMQQAANNGDIDEYAAALFSKSAEIGDALPAAIVMQRSYLADAAERVAAFTGQFNKLTDGPTMTRLFAEEGGDNLLIDLMVLSQQFDRTVTGVARGLRAMGDGGVFSMKRIMQPVIDNVTPQSLRSEALREIATYTTPQKMDLLRRLSAVGDPMRIASLFRRDTRTGKILAMMNEYWFNSILSGPATHAVNMLSSAIKQGVVMPMENMIAAGMGRLRHGKWTLEDRELWVEGAKAWSGMMYSFRDAWRMAKKSFEIGQNVLKPTNSVVESQYREISARGFGLKEKTVISDIINKFGDIINAPTRFLMAEDEFFSQLAYRQHVYTSLYSKGDEMIRAGTLTPTKGQTVADAISAFIDGNFDRHFRDAVTEAGEKILGAKGTMPEALRRAEEVTFTQSLPYDSVSGKLQKACQEHPVLRRFFAPFVRTPVNILNDAVIHTPGLAHLTREYRAAVAQPGKEALRAQAKIATGSMVWLSTIGLAMSGQITGGGPQDQTQKNALLETGWRPYSIKIGDKYVSYARIEPVATILGMAGDYTEIVRNTYGQDEAEDKSLLSLSAALILSTSKAVTSKTFMSTMADTMEALTGDQKTMERWAKNQLLSYIPAVSAQVKKAIDPEIREARGFLEEAKTRIPGLSATLPVKYSWLTGEPLKVAGGRWSAVTPVTWDDAEQNNVAKELMKFPRAALGLANDIGGVPLNGQQRSDLARLHGTVKIQGKTLMQALEKLIDSPDYDIERERLTDTRDATENPRILMLQKVIKQYREEARRQLLIQDPALAEELRSTRERGSIYELAGQALFESRLNGYRPTGKLSEAERLKRNLKGL